LETVALEGFRATDAYEIGNLVPALASEAFARIRTPEVEAFVVPGGNFPTIASTAAWEAEFGVPVVTTNNASLWSMLRAFDAPEGLEGYGRLLHELPAG
jgi:maleate cis-trans isomerase